MSNRGRSCIWKNPLDRNKKWLMMRINYHMF